MIGKSNVTDEDIKKAFQYANFGGADLREVLQASVLKTAFGLYSGHTITCIMKGLGLIGVKGGKVTKKGKRFLAHAYRHLTRPGG